MGQPPFPQYPAQDQPQYQPPSSPQKQRRGPVVLLGVLVLVLVAVAAIGAVVILRRDDDKKSAPAAVATKPSKPESVEFRRVLTAATGTCPSPAPAGTFCDTNNMRYTLGKVELNGSHVSEVKAAMGDQGAYWYVGLTLDQEGTRIFGQLTTALSKNQTPTNQLAIVVGNEVVTAAAVNSPITEGKVQISGSYTRDQVEALAAKITG
jgi:preprotein translocase subunit SecD